MPLVSNVERESLYGYVYSISGPGTARPVLRTRP